MSDAQMMIRIGGDVSGAVRGLSEVTDRLRSTGAAGQSFGKTIEAAAAKATTSLQKLPNVSNQATNALGNLSRVAQDAPFGFIGIANNINPLLESFQRLKASTGSTGTALKAMVSGLTGPAGLGLALGVVSSLFIAFGDRLQFGRLRLNEFQNALKTATESSGKEIAQLQALVSVARDETQTRLARNNAIAQLQKEYPAYLNNITLETINSAAATKAINDLTNSIVKKAYAEALATKISQKQLEILDLTLGKQELIKKFGANSLVGGALIKEIDRSIGKINKEIEGLQTELNKTVGQTLSDKPITIKPPKVIVEPDKVDVDTKKAALGSIRLQLPTFFDLQSEDNRTRFKKQVDELNKELTERGGIRVPSSPSSRSPEFDRRIENMQKRLTGLMEMGKMVGGTLANTFGNAFDAIAQGENVFKALGEAVKGLILDLIKAAIQSLIVGLIMNAILPGSSKIAKTNLSGLGGLIGGRRAAGGPVSAGRAYLVGENRPELFIPSTSGRIANNIGGGNISAGRMAIDLSGQLVGRGKDLVAVFATEIRAQNRGR